MKPSLITTFRRASHNIFHNISTSRLRKHAINKFAKKNGLIYFGAVDQRYDEHRVIRGFTVSSTHLDNHYCIGPINGYDVSIVDRSDIDSEPDGSIIYNNWLVMAFDLHTKQDTPHIFINSNNHDNKAFASFFAIYPLLSRVNFGTFENYNPEFTSRFTVYSLLTDSIATERLLTASATRVIGSHFWPFSAELHDGVLYIYTDDDKLSISTLNAMSQNGLWLANYIDEQIEQI